MGPGAVFERPCCSRRRSPSLLSPCVVTDGHRSGSFPLSSLNHNFKEKKKNKQTNIKKEEGNSLEILGAVQTNAMTSGTLVAWKALAAFAPAQSPVCTNPRAGEGLCCRDAPLAPTALLMGIV